MKKLVLVLFFFLLIGSVFALEKTRIYGRVDPDSKLSLNVNYFANGIEYNQIIPEVADKFGMWEYTTRSDPDTVNLKVTYKSNVREFAVPVGGEFEISLVDGKMSETDGKGELELSGENITEESEETEEIAEETEEADVTGKAIFGDTGNIKGLGFVLIFVGLFVVVVIANLFSSVLLSFFQKTGVGIGFREPRAVKVVKLSEKRAEEAKKQEHERLEQEREERAKQERVRKLKEEINKLEGKE